MQMGRSMVADGQIPSPAKSSKQDQKHLDELLDQALKEFPGQRPPVMLDLVR
jgi:hypothetical protein